MIEKMLAGLIPVMFAKVSALPLAEKRKFADFIGRLCDAYVDGERAEFDLYLAGITSLPADWKTTLSNALWNGHENSGK